MIYIALEEATWLSLIVVLPKKNGKFEICVDFIKLNAVTKKDPYIPFTFHRWSSEYSCKAWCLFLFKWILWISLDIYNTRGHIQYNLCNKLGSFYLCSNAFWSKELTSYLSEGSQQSLQRLYRQIHENISR